MGYTDYGSIRSEDLIQLLQMLLYLWCQASRNLIWGYNGLLSAKWQENFLGVCACITSYPAKDVPHLGNKLTAKHVKWQNLKMKVSATAKTLSHSVSSAITFLRNLNLPEFKDSRRNNDFILLMNDIFDILNSKSKFGKRTKAPITAETLLDKKACLTNGIETLQSLKDKAGMPYAAKAETACDWPAGFSLATR